MAKARVIIRKGNYENNGEYGDSLGAYGCLIFVGFLVIFWIVFSVCRMGRFFVLSCSAMRVLACSFFFEFSWTHSFFFVHRETCFVAFR